MVGLDLGTSKVLVLMAEVDEAGPPNIIGVGESPCDGLRRGVVVNIDRVVRALRAATEKAERMAGVRTDRAVVSISGPHITSEVTRAVVSITNLNHEVREEDVRRVLDAARASRVPADSEMIHVIPRWFAVDGQQGVKDAVGMNGTRLEVETHIVSAGSTALQNALKCVQQAGYDLREVVFQGLASAEAVLSQGEMELGVCLIDIGAGTTNVVLYDQGASLHAAAIPVGGNHVTNDIAIGLKISLQDAETMKVTYGHTVPAAIPEEERIEITPVNGERVQAIPRRYLAEIVGPRMREIFDLARQEVRKSGYEGVLPAGVVVTGGGARLMGTLDAAQAVFSCSVRLGLPVGVTGLADRVAGPSHAAGVGLVKWRDPVVPALGGGLARIEDPDESSFARYVRRFLRWLRDLF